MPMRTKVLGIKVKVILGPNLLYHEHLDVDGHPVDSDEPPQHLMGLSDSDAQMVVIDSDQGSDRLRDTYIHEHLHMMLALAGIRDTITYEQEESVVKRISPILLLFLRENPAVYTYLTGRQNP